ncbi:MAG: NYN domain-containing protein [Myxococcales bacterium]|nr:NYN domain-containing protein [Myxococcales bacterium]
MGDLLGQAANLAVFCDFENVAIGVRDARYDTFDVNMVLERLLDKGKIVVKKAYADWSRYKTARRPLHESAFELIEIPHVSYSGKNSADIRLVVDALDLCYTKQHVDVFVIVSGDSDFSPLVSKLRENDKVVIGLGVKNSSSDLLIENCDEFIYYDDLVRARAGAKSKRRDKEARRDKERGSRRDNDAKSSDSKAAASTPAAPAAASGPADSAETGDDAAQKKDKALEMVLDTVDSLFRERDDNLWGSMVKQTLKRKRPNFNESFHGYRNFNELLEDAQGRGLLDIQKDARSGGYIILGFGPKA